MPIDTIETILTRYSCRAFTDKAPSDQDLRTIAQAGVCAPSGMNRQPWQVIVLKNKDLICKLEEEGMKNLAALPDQSIYERIQTRGGRLYYNAPCMMLVPIAEDAFLDCGIVTENIALAATSLGIDTLICGLAKFSFAGAQGNLFKEKLRFQTGYDLGIAVLLGYAEYPGGAPHVPDMNKILWID